MPRPLLVVVAGPPGSGKTTLAHALAAAIPCPAICRDEVKEGLVHADGVGLPEWGGAVATRAFELFYAAAQLLVEGGASIVLEAAFKRGLSEAELAPLLELADGRLVYCSVTPDVARDRFEARANDPVRQLSHPDEVVLKAMDRGELRFDDFFGLKLDVPTMTVDATDGYSPPLAEVLAFVSRDRGPASGVKSAGGLRAG